MFKTYLETQRAIITEDNPNNGICFDGAVEPSQYFGNKCRLAFLLKETNGNKSNGERNEILSDWDYMEWVREQASNRVLLYNPFGRHSFSAQSHICRSENFCKASFTRVIGLNQDRRPSRRS